MLDNRIRASIDPGPESHRSHLDQGWRESQRGDMAGFAIGLLAVLAISFEAYWTGLALLLASRLCDGLDGAVARIGGKTDLGGFLDIVLDFAFYGAIPLAFVLANPDSNAVAGATVLLAFYVNGASFLAYALMAEKRGVADNDRGSKSLLYTVGLAEATETIAVFCLWCIFPQWFAIIAYGFAAVVLVTTISRFALAYGQFR